MACLRTPFEVTNVLLHRGHGKQVGSWWEDELPKASRGGGSPGSTIFPSGPINTLGLRLSLSSSTYRDPIDVKALLGVWKTEFWHKFNQSNKSTLAYLKHSLSRLSHRLHEIGGRFALSRSIVVSLHTTFCLPSESSYNARKRLVLFQGGYEWL